MHALTAGMFSANIFAACEVLTTLVRTSHGVHGDFIDYLGRSIVEGRANGLLTVVPTGALPSFKVADEFFGACDFFLATAATITHEQAA